MTAPTSLPVVPAVTRSGGSGSARAARADDGAPAFASALDDALTDTRPPGRTTDETSDGAVGRGTERAAERATDRATERASTRSAVHGEGRPTGRTEEGTDGGKPAAGPTAEDPAADPGTDPAGVPVVLAPGLWALLAAATPLTAATTGTDTSTAAARLIGTVSGVVTSRVGLPALDPAAPGAAALVGPATDRPTADPGAALPAAPPAPAVPVATGLLPPTVELHTAAPDPVGAGLAAMAEAAGLTVVPDPGSAAGTTPARSADPAVKPQGDLLTPVPAPGAGNAPDAGTDGAAGDPASELPPATESAPPASADPGIGTPLPLSGPAPLIPSASAAGSVPAPPGPTGPPVAQQLGRSVAVLRNTADGSQTMTVVLTPESLGPVTVEVRVTHGTLDLTLHGAHDAGRHALLEALPELRRELEGAGLTLSRLEVDASGSDPGATMRDAQRQLLDARAGQQGSDGRPGQQESRPRSWDPAADSPDAVSTALTTDPSTSSGVDVRA